MKLLSNKITNTVKFGRIEIDTRIGVLKYSYSTGLDYEANYQLESVLSNYHELTITELEQIDDIISNEIL